MKKITLLPSLSLIFTAAVLVQPAGVQARLPGRTQPPVVTRPVPTPTRPAARKYLEVQDGATNAVVTSRIEKIQLNVNGHGQFLYIHATRNEASGPRKTYCMVYSQSAEKLMAVYRSVLDLYNDPSQSFTVTCLNHGTGNADLNLDQADSKFATLKIRVE